jgi:hypothetical protein
MNKCGLALGLLVLVVSGAEPAFAQAERVSPKPVAPVVVNPGALQAIALAAPDFSGCASMATPDRTQKLIGGYGDEIFSQTPMGQGHPTCTGFVADFTLDKGTVNPTHPQVQFDGWEPNRVTQTNDFTYYVMKLTKAQCVSYKQFLYAYRKKGGENAFSPFGGGGMVTSWDLGGLDGKGLGGPLCRVKPDASFKKIPIVTPPTGNEVDVYRLVLHITNPQGQLVIGATHGNP